MGIKDLYLDAYKTRLKNREMKPELYDLYFLKTELWLTRQEYLKDTKAICWNMNELEKSIEGFKQQMHGSCRDDK